MEKRISPIGPALYFDVTDIVEHAMTGSGMTGVQRSVLRIVECVIKRDDGRPVFGLLKLPVGNDYKLADLSFMREAYDLSDFASRFELVAGKRRWFAAKLQRYRGRPLRRLLRAARLHVQWAASPKLRKDILESREELRPSCFLATKLAEGGVIVTLGAGWGTDYAGVHRLANAHGCKIVSFVHDLIALPRKGQRAFFTQDKGGRFRKWIDYVAKNSSLLACNSNFTKEELEAYLHDNGLKAKVAVIKFPQEFRYSSDRRQDAIRREVSRLVQSKYVLCVGAIGSRKNSLGLLQTWHEIQEARPPSDRPVLVLCGGRGRGADAVLAFLRRTDNVGDSVVIIDKANDAELELLYQHCLFTVFPSLFEGWGLPIGESLWFGKPVLCANNGSMPEAGGRFATYFDHGKPGSLFLTLKDMLDHPPAIPQNIRDYLTTWDDTAASLCRAIDSYEVDHVELERQTA